MDTAIAARQGVIVITHDAADEAQPAALSFANDLARRDGVPVTVYDRTAETWVDTPHPDGPFGLHDEAIADRDHLRETMQVFADAGVDVQAWLPTLPSISGITQAAAATGADVIVVAADATGTMADQLGVGSGFAETVAAQFDQGSVERPAVVAVDADSSPQVVDHVTR